jgi:hypothetical protein
MYTLVAKDRLRCANFETELMTTWRNCQPVAKVVQKDNKEEDKLFPANDLEGLAQPPTHGERKTNRTGTYDDDNEEDDDLDHYDRIWNRHYSSRFGIKMTGLVITNLNACYSNHTG